MKITLTVKANAKQDKVEETPAGVYRVQVKAPPVEGRANEAVIKVLAKHFGVPKSDVAIIAGMGSKRKVARIDLRRDGE
jgi:uncharacterized protein (TIGR00251 family)